jgi:hypothetical protein
MKRDHPSGVMPALVAGIRVFLAGAQQESRGWPGQAWPRLHGKWLNMTGTRSRNSAFRLGVNVDTPNRHMRGPSVLAAAPHGQNANKEPQPEARNADVAREIRPSKRRQIQ